MQYEDTIIAPATVPGTGAISILRISGSDAISITDKLVDFKHGSAVETPGNRIKFGAIFLENGNLLDEVLVNVYKAPHSYTGEDSTEIMCHASSWIVSSILNLACSYGARLADPGEFTKRAFLAGKMDLTQAEAVADLISSTTSSAHNIAMKQLKGGVSSELSNLRSKLLEMTALIELELDFSEEDVEFADRTKLIDLLTQTISHISRLSSSFKLGNAIKNGVPVAIVGEANAGKSTLLNAILGEERAIVSSIPGTTRDTIEECVNIDGILFRFIDTAGIRQTDGDIEKIGIERSFDSIRKSSVVIMLSDAVSLSDTSNCQTADYGSVDNLPHPLLEVLEMMDFSTQKLVFVLNKCELFDDFGDNIFVNTKNKIVTLAKLLPCVSDSDIINIDWLQISAKSHKGLDNLLKCLSKYEKTSLENASASSILISNVRHYQALITANQTLQKIKRELGTSLPTDLVAEDLRSALSTLGSITGAISTDEVLGEIFGKFCIGK